MSNDFNHFEDAVPVDDDDLFNVPDKSDKKPSIPKLQDVVAKKKRRFCI